MVVMYLTFSVFVCSAASVLRETQIVCVKEACEWFGDGFGMYSIYIFTFYPSEDM